MDSFGAIIADGIELTGIAKSAHRNVVNQTKQERELNPKIPNTNLGFLVEARKILSSNSTPFTTDSIVPFGT